VRYTLRLCPAAVARTSSAALSAGGTFTNTTSSPTFAELTGVVPAVEDPAALSVA
jgi:hypothetical protein